MRLGSDLLADPANVPLGWHDGEYVRDGDGNVTFVDPDPDGTDIGSIAVRNLVAGTVYAVMVPIELAADQFVAVFGPPSPLSINDSGLLICSFTATLTTIGLGFRAAGAGTGVLGEVELREVLEA